MEKITNITELNAAILLLENKQYEEELLLKEQFKITYESLKPLNFIRSTFKELVTAPDFKEDLLNTSISLAVGYFSKKLAVGSTNNPFKQILGSFLQMGVTSIVSKNSDNIRTKFMDIVSILFQKKEKELYK
ncbi:MAG: hypothetical protein COW67_12365 [Flavobacteriales bacterium CG18_big_fil_WC_8_21_14_2_50_32_9]|nr:MAG: hypothetical protein COW67_12365 [Flavobacteriales bacterium CG18_big_fil_WC_8_21_14_2_50_32_9]PJC61750.1 MAG: hypothetical protein CO022_08145 [Flavobacteriales bacterium CG_4_9_14_0_2_um_filter_32_27]